jgi:PAS domain S-box-containing protein
MGEATDGRGEGAGSRPTAERLLRQPQELQSLLDGMADMERRVAERTRELEERHAQLQSEMALRARTESLFRRIVESSVFGILWVRSDGSVVYANAAFLDLLGFSREDLEAGRLNWASLTPPEHRAEDLRVRNAAVATGAVIPYEKEYFRKDGSRVPVLIGGAYMDEAGTEGIVFVISLSDLRRAEAALRRSQDEVRSLTENSPDIVDRFDRNFVHLYVNPAGLRIHGLPAEQVIGKTIAETGVPEPWRRKWEERIRAAFETAQPAEVEDTFPSVDGVRTYHSRVVPEFDEDGTVQTVQVVSRDMTERRQMEEELRQAREGLEQQVKERTAQLRALTAELLRVEQRERRRIAGVLHEDLLQTLAYTKIQLESLQRGAAAEPQRRAADKAIESIKQSIAVARSLTLDLHPPVLHELGLGAALEWLAEEMQQRFGLAVKVHVAAASQALTEDLREFLFHAARELLFNVAKHSGVRAAEMGLGTADDRVLLEIQDAGSGFDPSQRVTGAYGLFSIRERAEYFGGTLTVASAAGKGTRVTVSVPRN